MLFQNAKLAIFCSIGFVIPQMAMGKLGNTEIEGQAGKPADKRSLLTVCPDGATLTFETCNPVANVCTYDFAISGGCKVTLTGVGAGKKVIIYGVSGEGSQLIVNDPSNKGEIEVALLNHGGCIVVSGKKNGIYLVPSVADVNTIITSLGEHTTGNGNSGFVVSNQDDCSFALGRFGGIGLGLFVTFVSSSLMF